MRAIPLEWLQKTDSHIYQYGDLPSGAGKGVREVPLAEVPVIETDDLPEAARQGLIDEIGRYLETTPIEPKIMEDVCWMMARDIIDIIREYE